MRGKLKVTEKFDGTNGEPVWTDDKNAPLNGYSAAVSNAVPSNLTKGTSNGVCSAIVFGNFAFARVLAVQPRHRPKSQF